MRKGKTKTMKRREFIKQTTQAAAAAGLTGCGIVLKGCRPAQEFDLVLSGGLIIDGTGGEPFNADVGIIGDRIARIGNIAATRGKKVLEVRDRVVCPGFMDTHDHSDVGLLCNPKAESHIRQGITSVISGNCGSSPFPIADEIYEEMKAEWKQDYDVDLDWRDIKGFFARLEETGLALNYATFVGQGSIRGAAMGFNDRPPKFDELERMKTMVAENVRGGALGLSTGLEYAPGSFAQADEVTELCRSAAELGGCYATHMRDEGDNLLEALDEAIGVARRTGASLQISHFKVAYPRNWHKIDDALVRIDRAAEEGIEIFCDRYPYIAGSTGFSSFNFPLWALQGTSSEFLTRLKDPALEGRLRAYVSEREKKLGSWDKVLISHVGSEKNRRWEGKSVLEGMQETGKDAFTFMRDLVIEENDRVEQIIFMGHEDNLKRILSHPRVGVGCDGSTRAPYGRLASGKPHPRSYGTFPRVLGKYVREERILPLPEMIKKMTALPARKFGFADRGVLQSGLLADITVFDPDRVDDRATWQKPHQYPVGIEHVIVNGTPVVEYSEHTGRLPGRILRSSISG
jgi:N-acyl-D-amino-acid deacylase